MTEARRSRIAVLGVGLCVVLGWGAHAAAGTISINLYNMDAANQGDQQVDAGETAGIIAAGHWNNIGFPFGTSDKTVSPTGVNDATGNPAATSQSTLTSAYVGNTFAVTGVVAPPSPNRDFMSSYLSWDSDDDGPMDQGNVIVSGLGADYTSGGYNVIIYSDADQNNRVFSITVDGTTLSVDDGASFGGLFFEGNGIPGDPAVPGSQENYVVFTGLTTPSFTIDMQSQPGRGAVNAIQVTTEEVKDPHPVLTVDRATGGITLANNTSADIDLLGYSITSGFEALDQSGWLSVSDNYDAGGDGSVDSDNNWTRLSHPASYNDLSEFELEGGDGGTLVAGGPAVDLGNSWIKSPNEDVAAELMSTDGTQVAVLVDVIGNGGTPWTPADFDFNGVIDTADWAIYNTNQATDPTSLSLAQAYQKGDLDGDRDNDFDDFLAFKSAFEAANGAGSFDAMIAAVPEPCSLLLLIFGGGLLLTIHETRRRLPIARRWAGMVIGGLVVWQLLAGASVAATIGINLWDNSAGDVDFNNVDPGEVAGVVSIAGAHWNNVGFSHGDADHTLTTAVKDDQGNAEAATFASTLTSGWVSFSGAVNAAPENGDRDMMASYLSWDDPNDGDNPNDFGNLTISGLGSDFTSLGYDVYIYSDADANNRTFEITVTPDGGIGTTLNTIDSATFDGTFSEGGSGTNENYVVFEDLTAADFTMDMRSTPGRGAVNGIQIISNDFVIPELMLRVNMATGATTLLNPSAESIEIDYYQITSGSDSLNPAGWLSLEDQDFEGNGPPGNGDGWEEAGGVDTGQLIESYLRGTSAIAGAADISLGTAYNRAGTRDLVFQYHDLATGDKLVEGTVEYFPGHFLPGDVNLDGVINGLDVDPFVGVLLNGPYQVEADMNEDGDVNGLDVDPFVAAVVGGGVAAVPEPATLTLLAVAGLLVLLRPLWRVVR